MDFLEQYNYTILPRRINKRELNKIYIHMHIKVKWDGEKIICLHNKIPQNCIECYGVSICPHNKKKQLCKICKGNMICKHNKNKQCVETTIDEILNF